MRIFVFLYTAYTIERQYFQTVNLVENLVEIEAKSYQSALDIVNKDAESKKYKKELYMDKWEKQRRVRNGFRFDAIYYSHEKIS